MFPCANNRTKSYDSQELKVTDFSNMMEPMVPNQRYIEFSERLNATLDHIKFPPKGKNRQQKLGDWFEVGQKGARKWLECEAMPRQVRHQEMIEKLNDEGAGITGEWLFYGDIGKAPSWYKHQKKLNDVHQGEYEVKPNTAPDPASIDISRLMPIASPATQDILQTLERGLREGRLNEDDIKLLETIAQRLIDDKNRKNR